MLVLMLISMLMSHASVNIFVLFCLVLIVIRNTQASLYASKFIRKQVYTQASLYASKFIRKQVYTQASLYASKFIRKQVYTQASLYAFKKPYRSANEAIRLFSLTCAC